MHCCSSSLTSPLSSWSVGLSTGIGEGLDNGKTGPLSNKLIFLEVSFLLIHSGIFVVVLVLLQHVGGVSALLSESKKNPQHKKFAFWVANLARVIVVLGWMMKGGDTSNLLYVSLASAILLIISFYNAFLKKRSIKVVNPEEIKGKVA